MREIVLWRGAAAAAALGWAWTAWRAPDAQPAPDCPTVANARAAPPAPRHARPTARTAPASAATAPGLDDLRDIDPEELPDAVFLAVEQQLKAEETARREEQRARQQQQTLDQVWAFADEQQLESEVGEALEAAVLDNEDRMTELGPPDFAASDEERAAYEQATRQAGAAFDQRVAELLGDELAPEFHAWMTAAATPNGPPPGAPGGPPPTGEGPMGPPDGAQGPPL